MTATSVAIETPVARQRAGRPSVPSAPLDAGSTMRAVAPIDLPDLKPAPLAGVAPPMIEHMRPRDLLVDETYQRELSPKSLRLIRSIVEGWDWLKFKAPVVAMTDRGFEVVDGQHTAIAAACHPDIDTIPVLVVDGSDLARRARAFVSHAVDRLQVRPVQVWHAAVAAGDEDATTIRNVLDRAGVKLLAYAPADSVYGKGETISLAAVRRLVVNRGAMRAREVLEILAAAELAPILADHIRVAEALMLDPEYAGKLDAAHIAAALRDVTPKQAAEAKEVAFAKRMPMWRALVAVLYRAHAPTKRTRSKATEAAPPVAAASPVEAAPVEAASAAGVGDVPLDALVAGIARWRRGEPWSSAWGPAPDHPTCAVPGALLGPLTLIVGVERREAITLRVLALWRRDGQWPTGWGPNPDDPGCAVPYRFRDALEPA